METYSENKYYFIDTSGTFEIVQGRCLLKRIVINTTSAGAITIYDGSGGSIVGQLKASVLEKNFDYDITLPNGLTVITAGGNPDVTVVYRIT